MISERETFEKHFWEAISIRDDAARKKFIQQVAADSTDMHARLQSLVDNYFLSSGFLEPCDLVISNKPALLTGVHDLAGSRVWHYQLDQKIGEGGMGVVFAADQMEPLRRRVAIKLIKPGLDTRRMIARFDVERQTLALMDHPNIAKILEAGTTETGLPFFAMELVEGQRITDFCDAHELSICDRLNLFLAVIDAVQHAHQKGIIHRDLKASNILVTVREGTPIPKVIDFGIAKAAGPLLTDQSFSTQLGQLVGTFHYMSPEQADRNQSDIDTRSDVYSLGVVLYELLTGQTPFDDGAFQAILLEEIFEIIRHQEPLKPSRKLSTSDKLAAIATKRGLEPAKLISTARGELDWIVLKSLEKDRSRRYESAASFGADIQRYLNHESVEASPPSRSYRFRKTIFSEWQILPSKWTRCLHRIRTSSCGRCSSGLTQTWSKDSTDNLACGPRSRKRWE